MTTKTKTKTVYLTEEPRFFKVIPASELEGVSCAHCREGFDCSVTWMEGYEARIDAYPMEKGDVFHLGCLRNYILPLANSGA
jgi:hypothetical protein